MRKLLLLFTLVMITTFGFTPSGNVKIKFGTPEKTKTFYNRFIGNIGNYMYMLSTNNKTFLLIKIKGVKIVDKAKLNTKYKDKTMYIERVFIKGNKLYIISAFYNSKKHKEYFFIREFDTEAMRETGELRIIGELPVKNRTHIGTINVSTSNDSSKVVVYLSNPDRGKQKQEVIFTVLNKNMEKLWGKASYLKYIDKDFIITSTIVDNNGTVYYAGRLYLKGVKKNTVNYKYHILIFKKGEDEPEDIEVNLSKYFIKDMALRIADNGDVIFAGFYSPDKKNNIDGSFYLRLDGKTHEVKSNNFKEFPVSFLTVGYKDKYKAKTKKKEKKGKNVQFNNFVLANIIMRNDGGIILVAERYYVDVHTYTTSNGGTTTTYVYHNNDIIFVNIDNKGRIAWNRKIAKWQSSSYPGPISYTLGVYDNNIYILVNDNPKNRLAKVNSTKTKPYSGTKDADLIMYKIDIEGKITKTFVTNTKKVKFLFSPKESYFCKKTGEFYLTSLYPKKSIYLATVNID